MFLQDALTRAHTHTRAISIHWITSKTISFPCLCLNGPRTSLSTAFLSRSHLFPAFPSCCYHFPVFRSRCSITALHFSLVIFPYCCISTLLHFCFTEFPVHCILISLYQAFAAFPSHGLILSLPFCILLYFRFRLAVLILSQHLRFAIIVSHRTLV